MPVHFAVDHYALADYDGTSLYEYPHQDVGVSEWEAAACIPEAKVRSFLQSAANHWLSGISSRGRNHMLQPHHLLAG